MVKINQYITGKHCIRNDNGILAVSDKDEQPTLKSYDKLFNKYFGCMG